MSEEDPLFRRIRLHASKRLENGGDDSYAERLKRLKEYMRLENEMLQRYHTKGDSGLRVARARSIVMDVLLEYLFKHAIAAFKKDRGALPAEVTLLALGGYGRQELSPFSDIDIMFLFPVGTRKARQEAVKKLQEILTNEILYPLWDLGLKVGHSTRTISEAIEEARADIMTKNALLEARFLDGSKALYDKFFPLFQKYYLRDDPGSYLDQRMQEQRERRAALGDTPFLQEPDIKNGVGALRDYQNILWMARIRLNAGSLDHLVRMHYLRESEAAELRQAYDFLLRVRNELHFQSKRPTDVLNLEKQPSVAYALGYRQRNVFKRVEAFMRDYYRHTKAIHMASKILERRLATTGLPGRRPYTLRAAIESRRQNPSRELDGLLVQGKELAPAHPRIFEQDPARLVRVFRHMQQLHGELTLELLTLIRQSVHLLTPPVIRSDSATRSFRSIMQTPGEVHPVLEQMHELGVLNRILPEFRDLTCLVQHELYHRYTADIHTLNTIRALDEVFSEATPADKPYLQQLRQTKYPTLLYTMLLLHDIGKGEAIENHAETGQRIARPALERLGVAPDLHPIILDIIRQHLEMARFWQRFDVEDPRTVATFADLVGDADHLRYLYVLTYCDTRGTAASLWNSYKEALHQKLFSHTLEYLQGHHTPENQQERLAMIQQELIENKLPDLSQEEIEAHFNLLPERYFLLNTQDEIQLHVHMIHRLLHNISQAESVGSLVPIIEWKDDLDQSFTTVHIVTWDRAGLFYKLAGAFAVAGLNILSTKAISRSDHITIDTFHVVEPGVGPVQNKRLRDIFQEQTEAALLHNKDMLPEIRQQARKLAQPRYLRSNDKLQVPISSSVDVYHELSLKRTIIEIQTNDHLGLLYELARTIFDHGYDITFARIATERSVAIDTFYIEPIAPVVEDLPESEDATRNLVSLREALTQLVSDAESQPDFASG